MAEFMLHHTHGANDCQRMFQEVQNAAHSLKGMTFFCTCPSGDHGGFFQVEAASPEEVLSLLPAAMRATTHVYPGESMTVP